MKTMAISEFKAQALKVMSQVAKTKESVLVTKHGKPLVEVVPFHDTQVAPVPGKLSEALVFEIDIVSPMGDSEWNACR